MGFGGSVSAMISTLKANRNLLSKKSYYDSADLSYRESEDLKDRYPKATEAQLKTIREQTIKNERKVSLIRISVFVVIFLVFVYFMLYLFG